MGSPGWAGSVIEASLGLEAHATSVTTQQPQRTGIVGAVIVGLVGLIWIAQGLGAPIGGGFMVGDLRWSAAGLVLVAVAGVLAWRRVGRRGWRLRR